MSDFKDNINLPGKAVREAGMPLVVSGNTYPESMAIAVGAVDEAGTYTIGGGTNWISSHIKGTGDYSFQIPAGVFSAPPVVILTPTRPGTNYALTAHSASPLGFQVHIVNMANQAADVPFGYIAMGPRA